MSFLKAANTNKSREVGRGKHFKQLLRETEDQEDAFVHFPVLLPMP